MPATKLLWLLLLLLWEHAAAAPTTDANMNGEYKLAPTPNARGGNWSTSFKDYPGGVESFTIYAGPVTSTYGEVFWTALLDSPLPHEIVTRFKGKGMAIVGYEVDQVRRGAGPDGEDVSVPINVAHTHPSSLINLPAALSAHCSSLPAAHSTQPW